MSKGLNFNKGVAQSPGLLFLTVGWVGTVTVRTGRNPEERVSSHLKPVKPVPCDGLGIPPYSSSPQNLLFPVGLSTDPFIFLMLNIYSGNTEMAKAHLLRSSQLGQRIGVRTHTGNEPCLYEAGYLGMEMHKRGRVFNINWKVPRTKDR